MLQSIYFFVSIVTHWFVAHLCLADTLYPCRVQSWGAGFTIYRIFVQEGGGGLSGMMGIAQFMNVRWTLWQLIDISGSQGVTCSIRDVFQEETGMASSIAHVPVPSHFLKVTLYMEHTKLTTDLQYSRVNLSFIKLFWTFKSSRII